MAYTLIDHILDLPEIDWSERLHPYDGVFFGSHYDWKVNLMPGEPVKNTELSHKIEDYTGEYQSRAYGSMEVKKKGDNLYLLYKDWVIPMEHFHYDTFKICDLKEDTIFITMPLTYHYDEISGEIDGFYLKLEPEVESVWFEKKHMEV